MTTIKELSKETTEQTTAQKEEINPELLLLEEYKQVKDDLRTWTRGLVNITAVWWALNGAFFGFLIMQYEISPFLDLCFRVIAVCANVAVYIHVRELKKAYHCHTQWLRKHIIGYARIPKLSWTTTSYEILGWMCLLFWGGYLAFGEGISRCWHFLGVVVLVALLSLGLWLSPPSPLEFIKEDQELKKNKFLVLDHAVRLRIN